MKVKGRGKCLTQKDESEFFFFFLIRTMKDFDFVFCTLKHNSVAEVNLVGCTLEMSFLNIKLNCELYSDAWCSSN